MSQENIRTVDEINISIYDKQNFNSNIIKYWNKKNLIFIKILQELFLFFIFYFLFILCDRASENMQQHQKLIKYEHFYEWYHIINL